MTSNKQWDRLTQWINQQLNARAVYLGDIRQLTAIEAGQPFALAMHKKAIRSVTMTDIVRQKEGALKQAVHAVIDKVPESAIDHLQQQPQHPVYAHGQTSKNHVVSTYRRITGDRKHDRELADQALNAAAANDYLARTPAARKNTLIIAYTHKERDDIAQRIREGLQQEGRLDTQEKPIPRLRSLGLERAAMATMAPYQPGLVLTVSPNDYYHIADVNKLNGFVSLQHIATGQKRYFFSSKHDHRFTQLWSLTTPKLAVGDAVMLKHTDRRHSEPSHTTYTVKAIGKDTVTLRDSRTQQQRILATNNLKDAYWDYAYTSTADLAQGMTVDNVITVIRSSAQLTNIRRAYIDITRAAQHVQVFTDSADKTVPAWYNHPSDKASAITTLENDRITPDAAHTMPQNTEKQASDSVMHDRSSDHDAEPTPSHHPHQPPHPKDHAYEKGERSL